VDVCTRDFVSRYSRPFLVVPRSSENVPSLENIDSNKTFVFLFRSKKRLFLYVDFDAAHCAVLFSYLLFFKIGIILLFKPFIFVSSSSNSLLVLCIVSLFSIDVNETSKRRISWSLCFTLVPALSIFIFQISVYYINRRF